MKNPKASLIFCVLCWSGAVISGILTGYMFHFTRQFPGVEAFARNACLAGALSLLWLAAAAYFTLRARAERKEKKK